MHSAETVRLTALASCAGCAAKLDPAQLSQMLRPISDIFHPIDYPALLIGLNEPDDAAVYQLNPDQAVISTVDFFPPIVADPYLFGAIAAANALSDVYAMGGEPLFAINLAAFPDSLSLNVLSEILRGGSEKVREAGAVIAGGHTIVDPEPKYGLCVTGLVRPGQAYTKGGAQPGDALVLTKRLGTGVITTAAKRALAAEDVLAGAVDSMLRLNQQASRIARQFSVHAMTDVTGFSLMGHGHEMARLSRAALHIRFSALQWLAGAEALAQQDIFPGGKGRNQAHFGRWVSYATGLAEWQRSLLFDPQTSGGLLIALPGAQAASYIEAMHVAGGLAYVIGEVREGAGEIVIEA